VAGICVFGLGEAGSEIAAGLVAAGADVRAYDPAPVVPPAGVQRFDDPAAAVLGVATVLAITAAADARSALEQAHDEMPEGCHYADLATASPALKRDLEGAASAAGLVFTDVALMGTVAGNGIRTPAVASGPQAGSFAASMATLGMDVKVVGDRVGAAATRKLLRSVFVKGLTAVLIESMRAAEAAGVGDETWSSIVDQVESADARFLRRLIDGTRTHAARRLDEMEAARSLLFDLDVPATMTSATVASLRSGIGAAAGSVTEGNHPREREPG
jgi:3-hydroxyisobutyrate dehydrogenase-like beta-hydroxyacid dehydrogenase